jgi:hypothetical protein
VRKPRQQPDHLALQAPEHAETCLLPSARWRRRHANNPLIKAKMIRTAPIRANSSAHAASDAPKAATAVDPARKAVVPPNKGMAQQAAQAAPTPTAAFQGLISISLWMGKSPTPPR